MKIRWLHVIILVIIVVMVIDPLVGFDSKSMGIIPIAIHRLSYMILGIAISYVGKRIKRSA